MTSLAVPLKQHNTQSRITLEIFKQCSSNLAPAVHNDTHRDVAMTTVMPLVLFLIKTKIPRFYLKQGSYTLTNLMGRVRQHGNHVCFEQDPLAHFERLQMGIFGFSQKETGAKSVAMATT